MMNKENYEPDPFDEDAVRRARGDVCNYYYSSEDADKFMVQKAEPALWRFVMTQPTVHKSNYLGFREGHIEEPKRLDVYRIQSIGIHTTTRRVDFYYYFYAMTASVTSLEKVYSSPCCVFTKVSGSYYPVDINAVTVEELLEDMKKAFDKARM